MQETQSFEQSTYNEDQWLKVLFVLSDTQAWLDEMQRGLLYQLPIEGKKKLLRKNYHLSASAFAHIIERHYYKVQRHPNTGKFTIPVIDILAHIRDCFHEPAMSVKDSVLHQRRLMDTKYIIGFDQCGQATSMITVISGMGGNIITAFPGNC